MNRVTVLNRGELLEEFDDLDENFAVIIMHNSKDKEWYNEKTPNCEIFYFDDVIPVKKNIITQILTIFEKEEPQGYMSEEDAQRMVRFIKKNIGKDFVVSCEYGKGRSVAVARLLERKYDYLIMNLPEEISENKDKKDGNSWMNFLLNKYSK